MRLRRILSQTLLLLCASTSSLFACEINIRYAQDEPYTFVQNKRVVGIDADIARAALQQLDCAPRFVKAPWARALKMLERGEIDMLTGAYKTAERQVYAHYSSIPHISPNILFVRTDELKTWAGSTLNDLLDKGFKLGAQIDVHYGPAYEQALKNKRYEGNIFFNSSRTALWRMLALGRVDGVIADEITGRMELKNAGLKHKIAATDLIISQDPAFYIFSKATIAPDFILRFDQALQALRAQGKATQIVEHYLN